MREIIFRGKRKDNGEWIYWNIYGELCRLSGKRTRLAISKTSGEHYYHYIYQIRQLIIPETIEYTGLTDKNGTKIFEGDILKVCKYAFEWVDEKEYDIEISVVKFENGCFVLDNTYSSDGYNELSCIYDELTCCNGTYDDCVIFEVIGNIHDNPELLKGGVDNDT